MKKHISKIEKSIALINNPIAPDNFITSYSDFLLHRESLPFYQFNPYVLENLLDITLEKWQGTERISRMSLLVRIKRYANQDSYRTYYNESNQLLATTALKIRKKLFVLFRFTFEETTYLSKKQVPEAQKLANSLLLNVPLAEKEEEWLCVNYSKSPIILNRLLRYPAKSKIISAWAEKNFHTDALRSRRAELLSWLLDQNPKYQLDDEILWEDYQYSNSLDEKFVEQIKERHLLDELLENQLGNGNGTSNFFDTSGNEDDPVLKYPVLSKRFYQVPMRFSEYYMEKLPDFIELQHYFIENFDTFMRVTMMWAIGYSRLNKEEKSRLLIRQHDSKSENTFFKLCEKYKLSEPLEWLKMKQLK